MVAKPNWTFSPAWGNRVVSTWKSVHHETVGHFDLFDSFLVVADGAHFFRGDGAQDNQRVSACHILAASALVRRHRCGIIQEIWHGCPLCPHGGSDHPGTDRWLGPIRPGGFQPDGSLRGAGWSGRDIDRQLRRQVPIHYA